MHCSPGGELIENCQSNPTQTLFVEGVLMTDQNDPSPSQKPNIAFIFFTWYPKIPFIIESVRKQDFKLQVPQEYDGNSHSQCKLFNSTYPASSLTPYSYPVVFSLSSKQKPIQLPSGSELSMIKTPSSLIKILYYLFSGIKKSPMDSSPITFGSFHPMDPISIPGK
ncbi:hypothetical protein O181_096432 [Austropuccinia psidii MF-1]|uniref:Uncharacterized protein n=1 Tax=Austropuccinia psidii MF-1 TaxID=1389203 RepID=A0A9Q3PDH4_9BASI|nr:hypothetical protein [Austropuccinia psidii MF-1]